MSSDESGKLGHDLSPRLKREDEGFAVASFKLPHSSDFALFFGTYMHNPGI